MLPKHLGSEHDDYILYPEPPQGVFSSAPLEMSIPADASYMYPTSMAMDAPSLYDNNFMYQSRPSPGLYEDAEFQLPSSNLSTTSAPSAASSNIGSPQSHHDQPAPIHDWAHPGIAVTPGIVPHDYYNTAGTEYSTYAGPGMEDFASFDFANTKPPGFVGELPNVSRTAFAASSHEASFSPSSRQSVGSFSTVREPGLVLDTRLSSSPVTPASRKSSLSFVSPSSASLSSPPAPVWSVSPQTSRVSTFFSQSSGHFIAPLGSSCWFSSVEHHRPRQELRADHPATADPSLIHPDISRPMAMNAFHNPNQYPTSPALSASSQSMIRNGSQSPFLHSGFQQQQQFSPYATPADARRPSLHSFPSTYSDGNNYSGDEGKEKQRCPHPECGKTFKDLKAHMLTHQNERPEKCPIVTCDYHVKGFARKYDKNRHTLTHYKGTMVCGFCPGSGSAAEKSFNRADVFKRHLTAVHGVEQTPPNSRKKSAGANSGKKLAGYPPDATGKCSTCSQTFSNAQDFYEHLDDCVLRIVQQEDPSEAINAKRLAEVENDTEVHQTLEKNHLPTQTQMPSMEEEDDEDMVDDDDEEDSKLRINSPTKRKGNPVNGVQKSRGLTHSRGGGPMPVKAKGRKNRRDYPSSWGFDKGQMTMKKRVMAVFEGPRRLAKDDMMLSTDHEVRIKLSDGNNYVTDLDVQTLKRAEGFLGATEEEKGPWISDDPTEEQIRQMHEMLESCQAAQ
ncbi:transcription factor spt8 [Colletotrichum spaethianum]|uniref:Transcription factor spt8 n=1 Tax=Colletotrichum spaethianum TaxID=700344 RepID=A0AA37PAW5_9PEZI|nr:transcription factor spt8 [Colletotrichum spaethianum]GKT48868.1 transcription factor spt8 [Colletotrichum spaethianum]